MAWLLASRFRLALVVTTFVLVCACIGARVALTNDLEEQALRNAFMQEQIKATAAKAPGLRDALSRAREVLLARQFVLEQLAERPSWVLVALDGVTQAVPDSITLERVDVGERTGEVRGTVGSRAALSPYVDALTKNAAIEKAEIADFRDSGFRLSLTLVSSR